MVKNKLSMASALIWKEEVVTEENLGNIKSQDSLHATGPDTRGENSASLTGVRVGAGVQETGSYSLSCAALPGTQRLTWRHCDSWTGTELISYSDTGANNRFLCM